MKQTQTNFPFLQVYAISKTNKYKDGAWQFIKNVICNAVPNGLGTIRNGFPILKTRFETIAKSQTEQEYVDDFESLTPFDKEIARYDENGRVLKTKLSHTIQSARGDKTYILYAASNADRNFALSLIDKAGCTVLRDLSLMSKLTPVVLEYYEGNKNAREVAKATEAVVRKHYQF